MLKNYLQTIYTSKLQVNSLQKHNVFTIYSTKLQVTLNLMWFVYLKWFKNIFFM